MDDNHKIDFPQHIDEQLQNGQGQDPHSGGLGYCESDFEKILDTFVNLGVYVLEERTRRLLYFNRRIKEVCPYIELGMDCRDLMRAPCRDCPIEMLGENTMAHTVVYSETFGDTLEMTATRMLWKGETPAIMISVWPRDISAFSDAGRQDTYNVLTSDPLTGGLTRAGFLHAIGQMQLRGADLTEYAVLFINITDFKSVNELVGSDGGDNLLRTLFADIDRSALHPLIGARKESDHFVFLVKKSELQLSVLPGLLNFHWIYGGKDLFIHCRCGIFMVDDTALEPYKMLDRAKLAKEYIVDEYVQPYAIFEEYMLREYSEHTTAFLLFDSGMKNSEFYVYYQPVIDAKTEKVVSAEALVRRITADGDMLYPGRFLPILERTGYISMLDRFVAMQVRSFLYKRKDAGLPTIPISFNISQKDFYDAAFMELLENCLTTSTLPKNTVLLEITESAYTMNEKRHEQYLTHLRNAGAKILLDDFGSGYSTFAMFHNYNFDRVKLDMSFVRQLVGNPNTRKVVRSMISMCHDLGVEVVAEGVESAEELEILRRLDCDYIQGYYFARPMDEQSFTEYLREHL